MSFFVSFELYGDHRDIHVLTHSCPTRRSSDQCPAAWMRTSMPILKYTCARPVSWQTGRRACAASLQIGRAHVCTPVTNAPHVCRLLLEKKPYNNHIHRTITHSQLSLQHFTASHCTTCRHIRHLS